MVQEIVSGLTTKSLMAFGLPSVIVQVLVPKLVNLIQRHPRGAKLLTYLVAFLSVAGTFTFAIRPLFEKFVWNWLPRIQLQSNTLLYNSLRRHVDAQAYPTVPNVLNGAIEKPTTARSNDFDDEEDGNGDNGDNCTNEQESNVTYKNPSSRIFLHKGTLFVVETPLDSNRYSQPQTFSIRAFAASHRPLKSLLQDAWSMYGIQAKEKSTAIYKSRPNYGDWIFTKHKAIRRLNTVDIDAAQKEKLIDDITRYVSHDTKAWYRRRGIPCRRGYLFHGPPGTGKSSLAAAIAGHFQADLFTMSMNESGLNDQRLLELLNELPTGSVLLIEDIDSAGIERESYESYTRSRSKVTLSGLLNALDGASAPEGHILIMSTNTPEALDPALRRAGRVDCEVEFKNASRACATKIFVRMMKDDDNNDDAEQVADLRRKALDFVAEIPDDTLSPAEIQGYLLDQRFDIQSASSNARAWAEEVLHKRAGAKQAAEKARRAETQRVERRQKELEAMQRKEELEEKALERREAAAIAFEEMERKTKEITLRAEKLRAEAEIARFEARNGKPVTGQEDTLMTPAESDEEQS